MLLKAIVILAVSIYSVSITNETVFARGRKRSSNKKHSSSRRKNSRKNRSQSSAKYTEKTTLNTPNIETQTQKSTASVENTNTNTEANKQQNPQNTITDSTKQEAKTENTEQEVKSDPNDKTTPDITKHPKWEEFRLCMQQGCSGSDDQPNNVECYKAIAFDNQLFKYFLNTFIPNEKKEFCENKEGSLQGIFENDTCKITIKFKRNGHKNECLSSCDKIEKTKTISINKPFTCSPDFFAVLPCYKDSPNCQAAKMKKITGGIAIAGGVISGVVAGVSAGFSATKEKTTEPKPEQSTQATTTTPPATTTTSNTTETKREKTSNYNHADAALTGISAGMEGVAKGTGDLVTASFLEKEKGEVLRGNCIFPDGSAIGEGMTKKITW